MVARGIRNANPGNIRVGDRWQGLAQPFEMTPEQKEETAFCVFRAPEWGIRAAAYLLNKYRAQHGLRTIRGMINRWAPPFENETSAYVEHVAKLTDINPDAQITNVEWPVVLPEILKAIIQHENGVQPYSDEVIDAGIALAGLSKTVLEPGLKPLETSKEIGLGLSGIFTGVLAYWSQFKAAAPEVVEQYAKWVPLIIFVIGLGVVANRLWARHKGQR